MRIYDPRLGKFLSVDPLFKEYAHYTPYQFSGNTPIEAVDRDGLEEFHTQKGNLTPYTYKEYEGPFINKVNAFLYNSVPGALYNLSSAAINGVYKTFTEPKKLAVDVGKSVAEGTKEIFTTPITWGGVKEAFSNPANYEAVPLMLAGVRSTKPAITITVAKQIITKEGTSLISSYLEQFNAAENKVMIDRLNKISSGEMKATEIDMNFYNHELREMDLRKTGMSLEEAHTQTLKDQNMYHTGYDKKLYTQEALDAGNAAELKKAGGK